MSETEFLEIVAAVCKRPGMYSVSGTFFEAVAFLEGYGVGANVGNTSAHSKFTPFFHWLVKGNRPVDAWTVFRAGYENDREALDSLASIYEEYVGDTIPAHDSKCQD